MSTDDLNSHGKIYKMNSLNSRIIIRGFPSLFIIGLYDSLIGILCINYSSIATIYGASNIYGYDIDLKFKDTYYLFTPKNSSDRLTIISDSLIALK